MKERLNSVPNAFAVLEIWAGIQPNKLAFRWVDVAGGDEVAISYGELYARTACAAAAIGRHASAGDRVVIAYPPGIDFVVSFFACIGAGAVAVTVAAPFEDEAGSRLRQVAEDSAAVLVLSRADEIQPLLCDDSRLSASCAWIALEQDDTRNAAPLALTVQPAATALLHYSTAASGGVAISQEEVLAGARWAMEACRLQTADVFLSWPPPSGNLGQISAILWTIYSGCSSIQISAGADEERPSRWLKYVSDFKVTVTCATQSVLDETCHSHAQAEARCVDLRPLRLALIFGDRPGAAAIKGFAEAFRGCGLNAKALVPAPDLNEVPRLLWTADGQLRHGAEIAAVGRGREPRPDAMIVPAEAGSIGADSAVTVTDLAEEWSALLPRQEVRADTNFLNSGGDSMFANRLQGRIEARWGVSISLRDIFTTPVLEDMAQRIASEVKRASGESVLIGRAPRDGRLPLSWSQQSLWFLDRLDHAAGAAYHMTTGMRLLGPLDREALRHSLDRIVARHEVLRTRFVTEGGDVWQAIDPPAGVALSEHDLSMLALTEREAALVGLVRDETQARFDLARGPLIRGRLVRLGAEEHALLLSQHHIVSDGWSLGVLSGELRDIYAACCKGSADPLPSLPIQYGDYSVWHRGWLEGGRFGWQLAYWREHLKGAPALLELPADHARPPVQTYRGGRVEIRLGPDLTQALRALSQRHGVTLFTTLLSAWSLLMTRLSGQSEVVVGTPVANRPRAVLESLIGFFVNTLPLRLEVPIGTTLSTLLAQTQAVSLAGYEHQDVPFEQIVEALQPRRSLGYSPIFQTLLTLNNVPLPGADLAGLRASPIDIQESTSQFDLSLTLSETPEGVAGQVEYASDLFEQATAERWAGHLVTLLEAMASAGGDTAVSSLPLVDAVARERQLVEWNATSAAFPAGRCVHALFEEQAARMPDAVAVTFGEQRLSYGELDARANRLARRLIAMGVRAEDRVGLYVERGLAMAVGLLGVLKAGGTYLPIDPKYPRDRVDYMLADGGVKVLICESRLVGRVQESTIARLCLDIEMEGPEAPDNAPSCAAVAPDHAAYVIYTSGSTGRPKGVVVEHGELVAHLYSLNAIYKVSPSDAVLLVASIVFDVSIGQTLLALANGARLEILPDFASGGVDPIATMVEQQITVGELSPSLWAAFERSWPRLIGSSVRLVILGGEQIPASALARWNELVSPNIALINSYGPTEAVIECTAHRFSPRSGSGTVLGRPLPNRRIYVLNGAMEPVPIGVAGELFIGGAGIARGYLNQPELTAQKFVASPFVAGDRLYRTGDLGRWLADGNLEFVGRADHQVKLRGYRIELGEIEAKLLACAGVVEAVVVARQDDAQDMRLVAYVRLGEGAALAAAELRDRLSRDLPDYMLPSAFVALDAFPLTPNGKLDRKALPAPGGDSPAHTGYEAPLGATETSIAAIWQELLGLERVGRRDNFFEIGGHSLMAVRVLDRMGREGLHADMRALFASPTLATFALTAKSIADAIEIPPNLIPSNCRKITPDLLPLVTLSQASIERIVAAVPGGVANIQDIYALAPLQEGFLFHHLMGNGRDPYTVHASIAFANRARLDEFVGALNAVVARHDILRTAIAWEGLEEPVQVVWRKVPGILEEMTLGQVEDVGAELEARFERGDLRLDIRRAPMMRLCVAKKSTGGWAGVWLLHHLMADHTAVQEMVREISLLLRGDSSALPIPVPYRNFVAQARLGISAEEHAAFFRAMLGDVEEPTAPFGVLDVHGDGTDTAETLQAVDKRLAERIRARAQALGVSTASLFHVAWGQVVGRSSGRQDPVFGTVLFGRMYGGESADRMLGLLINTLPVRIHLGATGAQACVRATHQLLAELMRHEHASLIQAQRQSAVPVQLPLFTALFNYRNDRPSDIETSWADVSFSSVGGRTNYPLVLSVDDLGEGFSLSVQTVGEIDSRQICAMMHRALETLVEALEREPDRRIAELDILPADEWRQIEAWNRTEAPYPSERCVHTLFEEQAARNPDAIAVVFGEQRLSYGELNARANRLAHELIERGVGPDDRVGLCAERGPNMTVAMLAVLKAGGAYVPLDPINPEAVLRQIVEDCSPVMLLSDRTQTRVWRDWDLPQLALDDEALLSGTDPGNPRGAGLRSDHLAYVVYTSGSTGRPKGVLIEHRNVVYLALNAGLMAMGPGSVMAHAASPAFDATTWEVWGPLLQGSKLVIVPRDVLLDAARFGAELKREGVGFLYLTVGLFNRYHRLLGEVFSELDCLMFGGDRCDPQIVTQTLRQGPPKCLLQCYGPTETTTFATTYPVGKEDEDQPRIPMGRPIANTRTYILDDYGQPVPIGVAGEVYVGGGGVGRGYLNRPELTAERFLLNPFVAGDRLYRSGDLGRYRADGAIEFVGRNDTQVKIRGYRVELGQIEAALLAIPGIGETVVLAPANASGERRLVAYWLQSGPAPLTTADLRAALLERLPDYMVPVAYVKLDAWPLTRNGKLDRKALPEPGGEAVARSIYEAPLGETETAIAAIWQELLRLERVGRHDNFFEIGGHSLMAIHVRMRVELQFEVSFPLALLFEARTLESFSARLAVMIEDSRRAEAKRTEELRKYVEGLSLEDAARLLEEFKEGAGEFS